MKKVFLLSFALLFTAGACNIQQSENIPNTANINEIRFTGTIREINNQMPVDGDLKILIDDKWIAVDGGELPATKGSIIGLDKNKDLSTYIGKRAEVFAKRFNGNIFTIFGDTKYYFKVIN